MDTSEDGTNDSQSNARAFSSSSKFSDQIMNTLGALKESSNSISKKLTPTGKTINGVPVYTIGSNTMEINDNVYELTDEKHKALSSTGYSGEWWDHEENFCFLLFIVTKNWTS